jgi:4-oxalocrotonate tautomerase
MDTTAMCLPHSLENIEWKVSAHGAISSRATRLIPGASMPVLTIRIGKGQPLETKRRLATSLTKAVTDVLEVTPSMVTVLIEEFERDNWATGGELHIDGLGRDAEMPNRPDLEAYFRKAPAAASKAPPRKAATKSPRRR